MLNPIVTTDPLQPLLKSLQTRRGRTLPTVLRLAMSLAIPQSSGAVQIDLLICL
jgi:hypothetical protein